MTRQPNKDYACTEAQRLLDKHAVKAPPVPVERIARSLGVRMEYAPLERGLSGLAYIRSNIPIVGINTLHAPSRQRFTLAHELAHVLLHRSDLERSVHVDRGSLRRDALSAKGLDPIEIEANTFAAHLLMPSFLIASALGDRSVDLEDEEAVVALAKRFKVSPAAMRYRLSSLEE